MSWKIRHAGSPQSLEGLTLAQVVDGLQDGLWEPTDEVMGPNEEQWQAIENHPDLAEIAMDLEPPPAKAHEDETRLDMNPLIDVALVLLIFFILTTSYAALQKMIEMPGSSAKDDRPLTVVTDRQIKEAMIKVTARMKDGKKEIKVENDVVDEAYLRAKLSQYRKDTRKTNLLIDAEGVDVGTLVTIQDAAKGAGLDRVYYASKNPTPP